MGLEPQAELSLSSLPTKLEKGKEEFPGHRMSLRVASGHPAKVHERGYRYLISFFQFKK